MNPRAAALLVLVAAGSAAAGFLAFRHYLPAPSTVSTLATALQATAPQSATTQGTAGQPPLDPAALDEAASSPPAATVAQPIPEEVPDIALADLAGKRHALREYAGGPQLFNFWATWCEPCRREIPLLNALQDEHRGTGLRITGIAVDFRDAVRDFLKTTKLGYALLVGEDDGLEAAQKFGMEMALPFSVFADPRHRIVAVKVGELHRDEAEAILARLGALQAGRLTLAAAREAIREDLKALALKRSQQSVPGQ